MKKILKNRYIMAVFVTILLTIFCFLMNNLKENRDYQVAIGYLRVIGFTEKDFKGYSKKEIITLANKYESEMNSGIMLEDEIKDISSEDIRKLEANMTYEQAVKILGETKDIGSGRYILYYRVDGIYSFKLNYGNNQELLGKSGEELLKTLELIA